MEANVIIIVVLSLLVIGWTYYKKYLTLKYRYRFYALRDKVRFAGISEEFDVNSWEFSFLDNSIGSIIEKAEILNLWSSILLNYRNRNNPESIAFKRKVELSRAKHPLFRELHDEYRMLLTDYIIKKHTITLSAGVVASIPVVGSVIVSGHIKKWAKGVFTNLSESQTPQVLAPC